MKKEILKQVQIISTMFKLKSKVAKKADDANPDTLNEWLTSLDLFGPYSPEIPKQYREAFEVLNVLISLRNLYWGDWKPNLEYKGQVFYCIEFNRCYWPMTTEYKGKLPDQIFTFRTERDRDIFFEKFRKLFHHLSDLYV